MVKLFDGPYKMLTATRLKLKLGLFNG